MKKSCPAFQGYPTCRGETTRSPELSRPPRRVRDPDVNSWLTLQRNKLKLTSARVTRGEGCLRYPRSYKWGLSYCSPSISSIKDERPKVGGTVWLQPMMSLVCGQGSGIQSGVKKFALLLVYLNPLRGHTRK